MCNVEGIKCQAKALESVQLCVCKYTLRCSTPTCDEPVLADFGLETLKCRKNFHTLKWFCKVMCMNDKRLP